uniref:Carboxylesterase type B domain-containing protein n=3 Tax=Phlebotomus papatasi TaxID=29031 RepID=A0A1B0D3D1_PHLPP
MVLSSALYILPLFTVSILAANISDSFNSYNSNLDVDSASDSANMRKDAKPQMSRVVHTKYGSVSGVLVNLEGRHLDPVEVFKGIPYASPPVGTLRFMPPVTSALWSGIRKADK